MAFEGLSAGDRITSESLLELARSVAALLVAGPGIEIKRVSGDKIIVSAAARKSLGNSTPKKDHYVVDYYADLATVSPPAEDGDVAVITSERTFAYYNGAGTPKWWRTPFIRFETTDPTGADAITALFWINTISAKMWISTGGLAWRPVLHLGAVIT